MSITIFAPAKLNLFLAVTGRRADGFHDLVSVAVTLEFGDTLTAEVAGESGGAKPEAGNEFTLACDDPAVPVDESNLVVKAARAWAAATGADGREAVGRAAKFSLAKRVPMGAGLGGGSSDGVAALKALNALAGEPLGAEKMAELAAGLGSDCALFLHGAPVVMRGRGERIEQLASVAVSRLSGRRVLVFKPAFGIATPWAYRQMAADPRTYLPAAEADARLAAWIGDEEAPAEKLLFNNMESVAFAKFVALPALLDALGRRFGLAARMSGSGSACFAFLPEGAPIGAITEAIREAWGPSAWVIETRIA